MAHYAKESQLTFTKEESALNRRAKEITSAQSADYGSSKDFTMSELNRAIRRMKREATPGPDDSPPSFLKAMGKGARTELLATCNQSFNEAECPQEWRNAIIIPHFKAGKPASQIASYRPISLTSCLVKTMERMLVARLVHVLDQKGILSKTQNGGRPCRSCEDHIIQICQVIEDGFQRRKPERTVMALFDYSKVFDRVWRAKLVITLREYGF